MIVALLLLACGSRGASQQTASPTEAAQTSAVAPAEPARKSRPGLPVSGQPAPALSLPDLETGELWTLSAKTDATGAAKPKGYMLAFMASWCGYCSKSLPTLVELQRDYPDLGIVTVTVDSDDASRKKELDKVRKAGLTGPVLVADAEAIRTWTGSGRGVPKYYFIDHNGLLVSKDDGFGEKVRPMMPRQAARALRD